MLNNVLKNNNQGFQKMIFWFLFFLIFSLSSIYIYLVTSTIKNVVYLEDLETKSSDLAIQIGSKEFDFINLKNTVTLSLAKSKGFIEVKESKYITPNSIVFANKPANEI